MYIGFRRKERKKNPNEIVISLRMIPPYILIITKLFNIYLSKDPLVYIIVTRCHSYTRVDMFVKGFHWLTIMLRVNW